ncbi:hypothetical protein BBK82_24720 [Lentzea guizhouensis]|uniref:Uncharacterized protein n=1 Tax=Lentzea guizhouensis TaxID=1586287 RepID=A0A1B2HM41_9PSEU|nr:hypothetical protein [Lentzea guizhouensis]ANZ38789.1 hypothetical protein BBK82_24720 [Lentzea guizhouensis]
MTDRRIAAGVVLLGGVLAGAGSLLDLFVTRFGGSPPASQFVSLWSTRTDQPGRLEVDGVMDAGWPVVAATAVMVVAALLTLTRLAGAARIATVVGAGALLGVVLVFMLDVWFRERLLEEFTSDQEVTLTLTYLPGLYLLLAGTLVGLAGAVLVQRHPVEPVVSDDVPAEGVETPVEPKGD